MQDLRLYFPGQLPWLAQAVEETGLTGPLTYDSESLFEWCEGEALDLPVRINLTRAQRDGEMDIEAPVYVRMFTRFDEPVEPDALTAFVEKLAEKLSDTAHTDIDIGAMSYEGGEGFSFAVELSLPGNK
ncbi:MAG TPA: hypothetical protein PKO07_11620 [Pseudomonadota bacterium]|nr:hypothetical protein [Pseudomonadota bacterium]